MDIYTADEQLLRRITRASQRARYVLGAPDPRQVLARRAIDDVACRLRAAGYDVSPMRGNDHFDLLIAGVRVEVKAATWSRAHRRYQAAMRGNVADVLVFGCQNGALHYFVVPWAALRGVTNVAICHEDVAQYTGRWRSYLERWDVLDAMIAKGVNAWQRAFRWTGERRP